jgi:hypothetical protein
MHQALALLQADLHMERARLLWVENRTEEARAALAEAQQMSKQTGYARRTAEAEELAWRLKGL